MDDAASIDGGMSPAAIASDMEAAVDAASSERGERDEADDFESRAEARAVAAAESSEGAVEEGEGEDGRGVARRPVASSSPSVSGEVAVLLVELDAGSLVVALLLLLPRAASAPGNETEISSLALPSTNVRITDMVLDPVSESNGAPHPLNTRGRDLRCPTGTCCMAAGPQRCRSRRAESRRREFSPRRANARGESLLLDAEVEAVDVAEAEAVARGGVPTRTTYLAHSGCHSAAWRVRPNTRAPVGVLRGKRLMMFHCATVMGASTAVSSKEGFATSSAPPPRGSSSWLILLVFESERGGGC
jgi:hypothetical protein